MQPNQEKFDVAILGSGIAGSTLAAVLARQGLKVVLLEAGSHPKFAIGESMILETSEIMRSLANLYDVPELAYFSSENYFEQIGTSHGVKRHFSYAHHTKGEAFARERTLQAVIPKQPHGHELHLYRQDTDYFLMTVAIRHGAMVLQNCPVDSVQIQTDGVLIKTKAGSSFHSDYVVDACGFRSLLSQQFDLRHHELETHSRAIFTHMVEVPCFHEVTAPKDDYQLPFQLSEGTLHHIFEGGWMWVIPFNNHAKSTNPLCSVGLMLDPRVHPAKPELSAEEEFFQFIQRFPSIAEQFHKSKAVRAWTRTGRLQYSAKQVVGDRFCLLGQAAGFIDPLFSKGLYTALSCTALLADQLLTAQATGDYSTEQFNPLEVLTLEHIHSNDQLVANAYKSFSDYRLWAPFSVLWLTGAYLELLKLTSSRALMKNGQDYCKQLQQLKLVGGGFDEFEQLAQQIYIMLDSALANPSKTPAVGQQMTQQLKQVPWMPEVFRAILCGKNHLPSSKLHPRLLKPKQGIMGTGQYRTHFFGDRPLAFFINFYLNERAKYSRQFLQFKRALRLREQGLIRPIKWGQMAMLCTVLGSGLFTIQGRQNFREIAQEPVQQGYVLAGVTDLVSSPNSFQLNCGGYQGAIVEATMSQDPSGTLLGNRLTLEVEYAQGAPISQGVMSGHLDEQGIFRGTFQTQLPSGEFSRAVKLDFAQDGSAQGVNQYGVAIAIQRS